MVVFGTGLFRGGGAARCCLPGPSGRETDPASCEDLCRDHRPTGSDSQPGSEEGRPGFDGLFLA